MVMIFTHIHVLNPEGKVLGARSASCRGGGLADRHEHISLRPPGISPSTRHREASGVPVPVRLLHADESLGFPGGLNTSPSLRVQ
jgi:hypothetical protein